MAVLTYRDIYEYDIKLYKQIRTEYADDSIAWHLFFKSYIDPDSYPLENSECKSFGEINCSYDGLLSIRRIHENEGLKKQFIETFEEYREYPIFFFPREVGGINQARAALLEDRIDHTLFDLKNYCESRSEKCKLFDAYQKPKTRKWLESIEYDFSKIVKEFRIEGIFVNDRYEVFDLNKEGKTLKRLKNSYYTPKSAKYITCWSKEYYENVKKKIQEFYESMECKH